MKEGFHHDFSVQVGETRKFSSNGSTLGAPLETMAV